MIQNERQYEISKKKLADLQAAMDGAQNASRPDEVPEIVWRGHQNGLRSLMIDLATEIAEFETLREGGAKSLHLSSVLDDLPSALARARVARGWTHKDLAKALGTSEQQVQKDESGGYARASLDRLHRVADALDLRIAGRMLFAAPRRVRVASNKPAVVVSGRKKGIVQPVGRVSRKPASKSKSLV